MKNLFTLLLLAISVAIHAQNTFSSNADSDPEARSVLEKMANKYEGFNTLEVDFSLEIAFPEEETQKQNINFKKKGESFRVTMPGRTVISDGNTMWMVLDRIQEVQINDVPEVSEDDGILSPQSLFQLYKNEGFAYYLAGQVTENGKVVQKIEFKPLDEDSDYSKMRLTLVKGSNDFVRVKAFSKDGSRFTVSANSISPNKTLADGLFKFSKADFPDYHVEDLRY